VTTTYKVLGQSAPSATTATTLYTVPSSTSTVVSTINVCNRANTSDTFRIAIRPAGATLATSHYIAYDTPVPANDSINITIGVSLATTDVITVYAGTANLTFSAFGGEIT
jgi:glucose-6-phosphate dehydrogenase assembly protein OpcA